MEDDYERRGVKPFFTMMPRLKRKTVLDARFFAPSVDLCLRFCAAEEMLFLQCPY